LKPCFGFCLLCFFLILFSSSVCAAESPNIQAKAAVLLDMDSGNILWSKNANEALPPASTTKILSAIMAIEMEELDHLCLISPQAAAVGESSANLSPGEELSLADLLTLALLKSANDACYAMGENVAGSEEFFVYLMNLKAAVLGAEGSTLCNTNGMPDFDHVMSAADLATIARYAMHNTVFADYVGTTYGNTYTGAYQRTAKNTNKLLYRNAYVIGVKTGTTNAAGACLVAAMGKNGRRVIAVVLNSPDRYNECLKLLEYGVENFVNITWGASDDALGYTVVKKGQEQLVAVVASGRGIATVAKDKVAGCHVVACWCALSAPVAAGEVAGRLSLVDSEGQKLGELNLIVQKSVAKKGIFNWLEKITKD